MTNEWIGRGKKGRGNPERRERRREGEANEPRGEGAEGAGGGARRLAPPPGLPGRFPSAAAAAPGCAARALPREGGARRGCGEGRLVHQRKEDWLHLKPVRMQTRAPA